MDRGRYAPDPGERVSVEDGALEPGSGSSTVDPGAQMDKDEHNRGGTRTLRLRLEGRPYAQVHRVWITRSSGSRSHLVTGAPLTWWTRRPQPGTRPVDRRWPHASRWGGPVAGGPLPRCEEGGEKDLRNGAGLPTPSG